MRYMDLFSGIGGFALGLRQAGIEFEEHWFSEIDKNAINIYKKHFPNAKELGDVRAIRDFSGIKADIITFGFPCQDLSVAGKRRGLAGDRSGLFFEAIECERLQGFPDGWTEYGADGRKMSDSARYKALGNAVTVNFPRMIGEKIKPVDKIKNNVHNNMRIVDTAILP